jgi:anthranilate/para-aminobenzoate synthase component I
VQHESPRTPAELLSALPADARPHLLDPRAPQGWRQPLLGVRPEVEFVGGLEALEDAERWLAQFRGGDPLAAVLVGSLSYELGAAFTDGHVPPQAQELPTVALAGFRAVAVWEPGNPRFRIVGSSARARDALADELAALPVSAGAPRPSRVDAKERWSAAAYLDAVRRARAYIAAGDVYQVNLARRLDAVAPEAVALRALYRRLADATQAPYAAYLETGPRTLLSSSPERFLRTDGPWVETCPIKGTRPRGRDAAEDAARRAELVRSAKDRAEHVMIVDLERNDLGRVCEIGSVSVPELAVPRAFSDVHHLVSTVRGRLRAPADWIGLLRATFPGGSITGAPKLRAMQIIAELEPVPRGVYTGAIGCIDAAGGVDLAIAIRTAVAARGELHLHLGGGIVADSDPVAELRETRDKGRGFARSWGLEA